MDNNTSKIVPINNRYRVALGTLVAVTLQEYHKGGETVAFGKHKGKKTKAKWVDIAFYPRVQHAIREVIRRESQEHPDEDYSGLQEYIERLDELDKKYNAVY